MITLAAIAKADFFARTRIVIRSLIQWGLKRGEFYPNGQQIEPWPGAGEGEGCLSGYDLSQAWTEQRSARPDIKFAARGVLDGRFWRQRTVGHPNLAEMWIRT